MTETFEYYFKKYNGRKHISIPLEDGIVWISDNRITFCSYFDSRTFETTIHRIDGPAMIYNTGVRDWVFNNKWQAGFQESWHGPFYDWTIEQGMDIDNLTDEDKTLIKMVWS